MKKVAMYWGAGCGGCDVSLLGLHEKLLELLESVELVFWPCAMDLKYDDLRNMPDGSIDIAFYNGAIRTKENEEIAKLLRKKAKIMVAYGSCATEGCVIGLANLYKKEEILNSAYLNNETTGNKKIPSIADEFLPILKTLDKVVKVDAIIPGCPPPSPVLEAAIDALLEGKTDYLASVALCDECPRRESKPDSLEINEIKRWHAVRDDGRCFLAQGMICMGIATRAGCRAECINANIPCTGCMGGVDGSSGIKAISAIASLIGGDEEKEKMVIESIKDVVGTFFKYSAATLLPEGRHEDEN